MLGHSQAVVMEEEEIPLRCLGIFSQEVEKEHMMSLGFVGLLYSVVQYQFSVYK